MKKLKQLFTILCAMVFMLGASIPTYATGTTTGTGKITIVNSNKSVSMIGNEYSVYRVFDLSAFDKESNNYVYEVNDNFVKFFTDTASKLGQTPQDLNQFAIKYITEDNKYEVAKELGAYVTKSTIEPVAKKSATEEKLTFEGLALGHYLVLGNSTATGTESEVVALASMITTNTDVVINLKADAPTIDKEIKNNEDGNWGNVGDNQIGDVVEYRFISTVPNTTGYDKYEYVMHDKMTAGLTFNNDVKIYLDKERTIELDEKYYTVTEDVSHETGKCSFDIKVDIIQAVKDGVLTAGNTLYTYFTATLNENAVVAGDSNDNTVELEYSNNPNQGGEGTTTTPEDTVKDYTFQLNVLKTQNDDSTPLAGAEFEIRKGEEALYFNIIEGKYVVCADKHTHTDEASECIKTLVSPENGMFSIVGLDDNVKYTLVETKAPNGFNPIKPIEFTITATYDADGNITDIRTNVDGISKQDNSFELGTTIINTSDSLLPETGGIGTTIFTVLGSGMMIFAAVVLIRKRKIG